MSDFNLQDMNSTQFDVLKEIGNIGAGNAATALAKLLGQKVDMGVPVVSLCDYDTLTEFVGGPDVVMFGILLGIQGDIGGMMMFLFEQETASHFVEGMMGTKRDINQFFDEMELSALNEVGNIISGAYLTALSTFTNLTMYSTVPMLSIDMVGALLSIPAAEFGQVSDQVLFIQTQFGDNDDFKGYFMLMPDIESYGKILETLGV